MSDGVKDNSEQDYDLRQYKERSQEYTTYTIEQHTFAACAFLCFETHTHDEPTWCAATFNPGENKFNSAKSKGKTAYGEYAFSLDSIHSEQRECLVKKKLTCQLKKYPWSKGDERNESKVDPKRNNPADKSRAMGNFRCVDQRLWERLVKEFCTKPSQYTTQRIEDNIVYFESAICIRVDAKKTRELCRFNQACGDKRQDDSRGKFHLEEAMRNEPEWHKKHHVENCLKESLPAIFHDIEDKIERVELWWDAIGYART